MEPVLKQRLIRTAQIVIAFGVTAGALWVFLDGVDVSKLGAHLRALNPLILVACAALSVMSLWLRAIRWRLMLPAVEGANTNGLFSTLNICYMLNNILPARAGEAARVFILWKRNRYGITVAIGSIMLERLLDLAVFAAFFALPVLVGGIAPGLVPYAWPMLGAIAGLAVGLSFYALLPKPAEQFAYWLVARLPGKLQGRLRIIVEELLASMAWVRMPARALAILGLSGPVLSCYALMAYLLAFQNPGFGLGHAHCASAFAALGAAIPAAPGFVGTLHAALAGGLVALGQDREAAAALAIVYHALGYIPVTLLGIIFFFRMDLRLGDITAHGRP